MTKEEWESLSGTVGWKAMQQFLLDKRAWISEGIALGGVRADELPKHILQCMLLKDLAEMDWETIENFYGGKK